MFENLFIAIAAGVIGTLPIPPAPSVVVTTTNVESSVVQYIESHEDRTVTLACEFGSPEISVKEKEPKSFTCLTTDSDNKETFTTNIVLSTVDEKVTITATLDSTGPESVDLVSPRERVEP